jgi:pyrimidine oxygenase
MKLGLFLPTASNGWLISSHSPQFDPSFPMMLDICERAERYRIEFALAMVKLHGFGGTSGYWDHSLEAFCLVGGLAARTSTLKLIPSVPILAIPPAICARMIATLDSIAPGRIALNIVTGWQKAEYAQMGLWPPFYNFRYAYAAEYATVLHDLWNTGNSDFKGEYFKMDACQLLPQPSTRIEIVCAGQSDEGMAFCARYGDYNFVVGAGFNEPTRVQSTVARVVEAGKRSGRRIGTFASIIVVADETDALASAKWQYYRQGIDHSALQWLVGMASAEKSASATSSINTARAAIDINMGVGTLVGSYASVAAMLDEMATIPGLDGVMLELDDWGAGLDNFATQIMPRMQSLGRPDAQALA